MGFLESTRLNFILHVVDVIALDFVLHVIGAGFSVAENRFGDKQTKNGLAREGMAMIQVMDGQLGGKDIPQLRLIFITLRVCVCVCVMEV